MKRNHYELRAAQLRTRARYESGEITWRQYERVANYYSRLGERSERKAFDDLVCEPAPVRLGKSQVK